MIDVLQRIFFSWAPGRVATGVNLAGPWDAIGRAHSGRTAGLWAQVRAKLTSFYEV